MKANDVTNTRDLNYFGDIKVLGNPVQNVLRIQTDIMVEYVQIYNIAGQQVRSQVVNNETMELAVQDLTAGVYFVALMANNQFYTLKIVKE